MLDYPTEVEKLYESMASSYVDVFRYHRDVRESDRLACYATIKRRESSGEGYLLIAEGSALEQSDLNASAVITGLCAPELLLRRAGHCNRRYEDQPGTVIVVGDRSNYAGRVLSPDRMNAYLEYLEAGTDGPSVFRTRSFRELVV